MAWKTFTRDGREDKVRMIKFLARLQKGCVLRVFEAWASLLMEKKRNDNLIRRVGARLTKGLLFRCFGGWSALASGEKRNRITVERFAKRMKNQKLFGSWGSWVEFVWLRKRARKLGYKVFNRICNASLLGAWDIWCGEVEMQKAAEEEEYNSRHSTEEEREKYLAKRDVAEKKREAGLRSIQRLMNAALANTLAAWVTFTKQSKHERVVVERFAKKMKYRQAAACLATWTEYCDQRNFLRRFMKRMLGGRSLKMIMGGFGVWRRYCLDMRQLELETGSANLSDLVESLRTSVEELKAQNSLLVGQLGSAKAAKADLAQRSMQRFIQQWKNKSLVTTMMAWKAYAKSAREDKIKMQRFILRMNKGWMIRCFEAWRDDVKEGKRNNVIIRRVAARMQNSLLARVYMNWVQYVSEEKRNRVIVARFGKRMMNSAMISSWGSWIEFLELRKRLKYLAFKVFNRIGNKQLYEGFEIWLAEVRRQQEEEGAEERLRYMGEEERKVEMAKKDVAEKKREAGLRSIQRLMNAALANTLAAWVTFTKQSKHERVVVERFAKKMKYRQAAACLATWTEYCDQRNFLRRFMKRMLGGRSLKMIMGGFGVWRRYCLDMRQLELETGSANLSDLVESLRTSVEELKAQNSLLVGQLGSAKAAKADLAQRSMQRFIQQWKNKSLVTTMMAWKAYAKSAREDKIKMQRFILRMNKGWMIRCFEAWRDDVKEGKRNNVIIRRVAARMQNSLLARVYMNWVQYVSEEKRNRVIVARFGKRMMNSAMISSWGSWIEFLELRKRLKYLAFKVFNRIGNKQLYEGWFIWSSALHEIKQIEHDEMEVRFASEADRQIAEAKKAEKERKRLHGLRTIQKLVHGALAMTLGAWIAYTKQCKHERMVIARFAKKLKNRQAAKCFSSWLEYCGTRDFLRRTLRRLFGGRSAKLMHGAFNIWYTGMKEHDRNANIVRKFALRMKNQHLTAIFLRWSAYAYEGKNNRLIVKRFVTRMQNAAAFRCLRKWMHFSNQRIRMRMLIKRCLGGKRTVMLSAAMKKWYKAVVSGEMEEMQRKIDSYNDDEVRAENEELKARVMALEESNEVVHKLTNLLMSPALSAGILPSTPGLSTSFSPGVKFSLGDSPALSTPGKGLMKELGISGIPATPGSHRNLSLWEETTSMTPSPFKTKSLSPTGPSIAEPTPFRGNLRS